MKKKKKINNTRVLGLNCNQVLQAASSVHLHTPYQEGVASALFRPPPIPDDYSCLPASQPLLPPLRLSRFLALGAILTA